jgi:peptidylprolyl isomerase
LSQVEESVIGMAPGDKKTLVIPCDEAFGDYDEERVFSIARNEFPSDLNPDIDQNLELIGEDGESMIVTVLEVEDDAVVLDANHPLAGEDLSFEIELVEIL